MSELSSEKSIFLHAAGLDAPTARAAYLDSACGSDPAVRARIEGLLAAHDRLGADPPPTAGPDSTVAAPGPEAGAVLGGRFKLLELIGEGGMGAVWLAEQTEPVKRLVALKVVKAGMDSKSVLARFEAERQALALMDHPNIAKVHDAGATPEGRPFFVMELVKGVPITKYCDDHQLTPRQRLELFVPVCAAVQHAHQKGIIHRDLKPSNVLVAQYDDRPVPKVIDFGVAKAAGPALTEQTLHTGLGAVVGTVEYMSPEQAELNQLDIDTRSDVYSLGVLLYELLTGTTPLSHKRVKEVALLEVLRIIREEEPPRPSTRLSTTGELPSIAANRGLEPKKLSGLVRGELDWIVMKCLEKDRSRRYESANALAVDVQRYLADEAVQACPPSAAYRLRKLVRRNKGPVLAGTLVLLTLTAGAAVSAGQAVRATRAEGNAKAGWTAEAEQHRDAVAAHGVAKANENKALEEKHNAELSEAEMRAVSTFFLERVLAAARPKGRDGGLGIDATIRAAIDAAEPKIDAAFKDQPRVEASIRYTLGRTYLHLGEAKRAIGQLERSFELYRTWRGSDDHDALKSMNELAVAYRDAGQVERAIAAFEKALEMTNAKYGPDHSEALTLMSNLAAAYRDANKFDRAITLYQKSLAKMIADAGPDDRKTLTTKAGLGLTYYFAGQYDDAVATLEETLARQKDTLGLDDAETVITQGDLGLAYGAAGRTREAMPLLEVAVEKKRVVFGPDHPDTLRSMNNLGLAYRNTRQPDRAVPLLEEALRGQKVNPGPDHRDTLATMNNLALVYQDTNKLGQAIPLFEQVLEKVRVLLGEDRPETLATMNNLARAFRASGQLDRAIPLLEKTLERKKTKLPPNHPSTLLTMDNLAEAYLAADRRADGLALYEETLKLRKAKLSADHPDTLSTQGRLAAGYQSAGRPGDAEVLWRELLTVKEKKSPDDWTTFETMSLLGEVMTEQKKHAEAEPLLLRGYEGMKQREAKGPPNARPRQAKAVQRLIDLYVAWDKKDKADDWRKKLEMQKESEKTPPDGKPKP